MSVDRVEALALAIIQGDAQLGEDGLYEIVEEHDGEQVVSDEAILVEDHLLALRAFARVVAKFEEREEERRQDALEERFYE